MKKINVKMTLEEKVAKFEKGFDVEVYDGLDLITHVNTNCKIKPKKGKMMESMFTDKLVDLDNFNYSFNNDIPSTQDIVLVNFNYSKDLEEKKNYKKIKTTTNNISVLKTKVSENDDKIKALEETIIADETFKKTKDALRKKVSRAKTEEKKNELQKELDKYKYTQINNKKKILSLQTANEKLNKKIEKLESKKDYLDKKEISTDDFATSKLSQDDIRRELTETGFTITRKVDNKEYTKEANKIKRKLAGENNKEAREKALQELEEIIPKTVNNYYKYEYIEHTSSKGRQGKTLFGLTCVTNEDGEIIRNGFTQNSSVIDEFGIAKKGKEQYEKYVRGEIDYKNSTFPLVEFGAYESLDQSALVDGYMYINPSHMVISTDVDTYIECKGKIEKLDKFGDAIIITDSSAITKNTMFDGACLVDDQVWNKESNFALLRNKQFKSGATKMPLQQLIKERCEFYGLDYLHGYTTDMYGNKHYYKDTQMITTDNSTKYNKFATYIYDNCNEQEALNKLHGNFVKLVQNRENGFGVVKTPHKSKFGEEQQMSYQMINSLDLGDTKEEVENNIKELVKTDIDRINNMKNDNEAFVRFLEETANDINNNQIWADLYRNNVEIANTKRFKKLKTELLNAELNKIKVGKLRFTADNLTIVPDPIAFVDNYLGKLPMVTKEVNGKKKSVLDPSYNGIFEEKDYGVIQIYSKKYKYGEEVTLFRSPHFGDFSVCKCINVYNPDKQHTFDKYLDETMVIVDDRQYPFQDLTAGSDKDSDFVYATNDKKVNQMADRSWKNNYAPINEIPNQKQQYQYNKFDIARKDIAVSSSNVGIVSNQGQIAQSQYTHMKLNKDKYTKEQIDEARNALYRYANAQGLAIDNAKRLSELKLFDYVSNNNVQEAKIKEVEISKLDIRLEEINNNIQDLLSQKVTGKGSRKHNSEINEQIKNLKSQKKELKSQKKELKEVRNNIIDEGRQQGEITKLKQLDCWDKTEKGALIKPNFFRNIQKNNNIKTEKMDCNMDILQDIIDEYVIREASTETIDIKSLLEGIENRNKVNKATVNKVIDRIQEFDKNIGGLYASLTNDGDTDKEIYTIIQQTYDSFRWDLDKMSINKETMQRLIMQSFGLGRNAEKQKDAEKIQSTVLKMLYNKDKEMFLSCFKAGVKSPAKEQLIKIADGEMDFVHEVATDIIYKSNSLIENAIKQINEDIKNIFDKFNEGIQDEKLAKKILNSEISAEEFQKIKNRINDIKYEKQRKLLMAQLNSKAYKARITRLEALKQCIAIESAKLTGEEIDLQTNFYIDVIQDSYYRNIYDIQKGLSIMFDFAHISENDIKRILNIKRYQTTFFDSINNNDLVFRENVTNIIQNGLLAGNSIYKITKDVEQLGEYNKFQSARLIRTETSYFHNNASLEAYKECDIEYYQIVATLDNRTSAICQEMDKKIFKVEFGKSYYNMPPFHPYCRTTIIAYFGKEVMNKLLRRARNTNTNKTYVMKNTDYKNWKHMENVKFYTQSGQ